ncbi:hypothetical protein T4D_11788 [Trichinella pseudospiralis]|uniref:Uncharacterized protein n=1 Tax=Trichinella pseudospiralis TaxID=6337 RepID=A0A0V1F8G6_TRIPS|nr:hypothetical protein T4D_11788 [Trichinella pseudospiralis]
MHETEIQTSVTAINFTVVTGCKKVSREKQKKLFNLLRQPWWANFISRPDQNAVHFTSKLTTSGTH